MLEDAWGKIPNDSSHSTKQQPPSKCQDVPSRLGQQVSQTMNLQGWSCQSKLHHIWHDSDVKQPNWRKLPKRLLEVRTGIFRAKCSTSRVMLETNVFDLPDPHVGRPLLHSNPTFAGPLKWHGPRSAMRAPGARENHWVRAKAAAWWMCLYIYSVKR